MQNQLFAKKPLAQLLEEMAGENRLRRVLGPIQLTSVAADRLEGRWEGYPRGSQINPITCERSGARTWEDVAWLRE